METGKAKEDKELADEKQLIANLLAKAVSLFGKLGLKVQNVKDDDFSSKKQLDNRIRLTRSLTEQMNRYDLTAPKPEDTPIEMAYQQQGTFYLILITPFTIPNHVKWALTTTVAEVEVDRKWKDSV